MITRYKLKKKKNRFSRGKNNVLNTSRLRVKNLNSTTTHAGRFPLPNVFAFEKPVRLLSPPDPMKSALYCAVRYN